jgi:UDPglucose--hexose-1-phosphate uridylyltransferase
MEAGNFYQNPHRRFNPLTGDWVLVSPHRAERPWSGQLEVAASGAALTYDPNCYLCPGNERAGGARNSQYQSTFVFSNDFAALKPPELEKARPSRQDESGRGLLLSESEAGICKVICFSPRHEMTLARMTIPEITRVVETWAEQYSAIGSLPYIQYVQIFENRGEMMGCSNAHPHGQIWANQTIPNEPRKEQQAQKAYLQKNRACLLCDYLQMEAQAETRMIVENAHFTALVPFWAVWPFEVMLLSKVHVGNLGSLDAAMRTGLADIFKQLTTRYDNLFEISFPYSMGFHQSPTDEESHPEWHLHAHFYPPLLRSSMVRKFMVGYEMMASPQRDITPEAAAATLRNLSGIHYSERRQR